MDWTMAVSAIGWLVFWTRKHSGTCPYCGLWFSLAALAQDYLPAVPSFCFSMQARGSGSGRWIRLRLVVWVFSRLAADELKPVDPIGAAEEEIESTNQFDLTSLAHCTNLKQVYKHYFSYGLVREMRVNLDIFLASAGGQWVRRRWPIWFS